MSALDKLATPIFYALLIGSATAALVLPQAVRERRENETQELQVRSP